MFVFRCDDVSAFSDSEDIRRILELFGSHSIPLTLGIIPCRAEDVLDAAGAHGRSLTTNRTLLDMLRSYHANGRVEMALHGYAHQNNRFHAGKTDPSECSEFRGLPFIEQAAILRQGTEAMAEMFGDPPSVFIPPWNTLDDNTINAALEAGISVVSGEGTVFLGAEFHDGWTNIGCAVSCAQLAATLDDGSTKPSKPTSRTCVVLFHPWDLNTPQKWSQLIAVLSRLKSEGWPAATLSGAYTEAVARGAPSSGGTE